MGSKTRKWLNACLIVLLLSNPLTVHAETTAVDLYNFFDIPYSLVYPEEVLDTINTYMYAQKFDHMYKYVVTSQYDETILTDRIEAAESRIKVIEEELAYGYSLDKEEIYSLESEYVSLLKHISDERSKLDSVEVKYTVPSNENTPTYYEYVDACNNRASVEAYADIGTFSVPMKAPVASSWLINDFTETSVTFKVAEGTSVNSLWNGEVISIDADKLIISCHNEILLGYSGMQSTSVHVGDTVYQGQPIGKAKSDIKLKLSLNGTFVDISKLFIEE